MCSVAVIYKIHSCITKHLVNTVETIRGYRHTAAHVLTKPFCDFVIAAVVAAV